MDLFGKFRKLDSSLQRGLDNGFARVFGGEVVPAEIDDLLKQQAETSVMVDDNGETLASSYYTAFVSQHDLDILLGKRPDLAAFLTEKLSRYIRNAGWRTSAPVEVRILADERLHSGQLKSSARFDLPTEWAGDGTPERSERWGEDATNSGSPADEFRPNTEAELTRTPQPTPAPDNAPDGSAPSAFGQDAAGHSVPGPDYSSADAPDQDWPDQGTTGGFAASDATPQGYAAPGAIGSSAAPATHSATSESTQGAGFPDAGGEHQVAVTLVLRDGSDRRYALRRGSNVIGRGNGVDLRIPDTGVSRQHAEIQWDGYDAVLTDLQSTNGTTVNDTPVENWLLAHGDIITMGHSEIEVHFH